MSKKAQRKVLQEETKAVYLATGKHLRHEDLLKANVDVDFVVRLERKNDSHTVSNKIFDFSKTPILGSLQYWVYSPLNDVISVFGNFDCFKENRGMFLSGAVDLLSRFGPRYKKSFQDSTSKMIRMLL